MWWRHAILREKLWILSSALFLLLCKNTSGKGGHFYKLDRTSLFLLLHFHVFYYVFYDMDLKADSVFRLVSFSLAVCHSLYITKKYATLVPGNRFIEWKKYYFCGRELRFDIRSLLWSLLGSSVARELSL